MRGAQKNNYFFARGPGLLAGGALWLLACSSTVTNISAGDFAAPVGLAATSAGDRDLLFVANSGRDGLIALQLCNRALLADGGVDPADTCNIDENAQFLPGPIRVFPETIEAGPGTVRVAGARLLPPGVTDPTLAVGAALTVGADQTVRVIDAKSLVDAEHGNAPPKPVLSLPIGALGVDIAAANPLDPATDLETAAASVKVFVVTTAPARLLALSATLDPSGAAQLPTVIGSCDLGPVVPTKLALAPGKSDLVYVADGAGDGVVSVPSAAIAGGSCPLTRISAGGRSVRSVAVSPPWYETGGATHPAGELLMMVLEPLTAPTTGEPLDAGGVLFVRVSDGAIIPIPPFGWAETGHEAMQPLQTSGLAREGTFLRSLRPGTGGCNSAPCTPLYISTTANPSGVVYYDLLAAVTTTDGSTWFIDVTHRRFPDIGFFPTPSVLIPTPVANPTTLSPAESDPLAPILTIDPNSTTAGVTHSANWRAIWHSPFPGLDRRAGVLSQGASGTLSYVSPPADFSVWTQDPALHLGPGDVVAFTGWSSSDPNCTDLVTTQNANALRYELPIQSIAGDTLTLGQVAGTVDLSGACASAAAVAEIRAAGTQPWMVFSTGTVVGRATTGQPFTVHEQRFDYPFDPCASPPVQPCYDPSSPPLAADNVSFTFTISGDDPLSAFSSFSWAMQNSQSPVLFRDGAVSFSSATAVLAYSSPRTQTLVFTSNTGANEIVQADPFQLTANVNGIQAYR